MFVVLPKPLANGSYLVNKQFTTNSFLLQEFRNERYTDFQAIRDDDDEEYLRRPSNRPPPRQHRSEHQFFRRDNHDDGDYGRRDGRFEESNLGQSLKDKDWSNADQFERNVYKPKAEMSADEAEQFRTDNAITIVHNKDKCPAPVSGFDDVDFPPELVDFFAASGFESPMPIQAQGWPIALSGRDLIAIGQTGSGKTLGFLLPAVMHVLSAKQAERTGRAAPRAVVVAPTRELAQQTEQVLFKLTKGLPRESRLYSACLYGGASKGHQIERLQRGADVVIATPGRLIDLLEGGFVSLDSTTYFVLDEADRMLDMGFEPQIRKILTQIRPDRQMQMWSATWPEEVQDLAQDLLSSAEASKRDQHVHLNIGSTELQANPDITQNVEVMEPFDKQGRLVELVEDLKRQAEDSGEPHRVLIFSQTKRTVDHIDHILNREGHRVRGIHGDRTQAQRNSCLNNFRSGRTNILVATDVASRGLDVDDIGHVINYDFPDTIESYVHRIGRTGRRGKKGTAHSFLTSRPDDARLAKPLIKVLKQAGQNVPQELYTLAPQAGKAGAGKGKFSRYQQRGYNDRSSRYNRDFVSHRSQYGSNDRRHGGQRNLYDDDY